jgi:sulfur-oxidizing protein SoxY
MQQSWRSAAGRMTINGLLVREDTTMDAGRREALKKGGGLTLFALLAAAGWLPQEARAEAAGWNQAAFDTHAMDETLKALGGSAPTQSKDIVFFSTPDIAENGAVVPVGITSSVPNTQSIAILIEKNPNMLAAVFDIPAGTEPSLSTRVKMGQSSNVYALVKADGKYYVASKEIKVTLGGCGG